MRTAHAIYALVDPETGRVRYVGQTSRPLGARLYHHVWDAVHHPHKNRKDAWICNLAARGLRPAIVLLERAEDWKTREKFWVAQFPDLLNCTEGGEGIVGYRHTPEARQKIAAANRLKAGKKRSPEAVENIRRGQLGRKATAETRAKMSKAKQGRTASPETKARMRATWSSPERREQCRQNAMKRWDREREESRRAMQDWLSRPESTISLSMTQTN